MKVKADDVTIKMWTIRPTSGGVCVDGLRVGDATGMHWHSSAIAKRVGNRLLETASGSRYRLLGDLDSSYAREISGYLLSVTSKFKHGFPVNWKQLVETARKLSAETHTKPSKKTQNGQQLGTKYTSMEPSLAGESSVVRRSQRGRVLVRPYYLQSPDYKLSTEQKDKRLDSNGTKNSSGSDSLEIKSEENSLDETADGTILALRRQTLLGGPSIWKRRHSNSSSDRFAKRRKVERKGEADEGDVFLTPRTPAANVDVDDNVVPRKRNRRPLAENISTRIVVPPATTSDPNATGKNSFVAPLSPCTTSFIRLPMAEKIFDNTMDTSFFDCILAVERKKSRSATPKSARPAKKRKDSPSEIAIGNDRQKSSYCRLHPLEIGEASNAKAKNVKRSEPKVDTKVKKVKRSEPKVRAKVKKVRRSEPKVSTKAVAAASVVVDVRRSARLRSKAEVARSSGGNQKQNLQLQNDGSVSHKARNRSKMKASKRQNTLDLDKRTKMKKNKNINSEENVKTKTATQKKPKLGSGQQKPQSNGVKSRGNRKNLSGSKSSSSPGQSKSGSSGSKSETSQLQSQAKHRRSQSMADARISVNSGSKSGRSKSETKRSQSRANTGRPVNKGSKSGRSKAESTRSQPVTNTEVSVNHGSKSGRSKSETRRSQSWAETEVSVASGSKSSRSKSESTRSQPKTNTQVSLKNGSKSGRPKSEMRRSQSQANSRRSVNKCSKSGRSKSETRISQPMTNTEVSVTNGSKSGRSKSEARVLPDGSSVGKSGHRGSESTKSKSETSLIRSSKSGRKPKTAVVKLHNIKRHLAASCDVKSGTNDFSQANKEITTSKRNSTQLTGKKGESKQKNKKRVPTENGVGKSRKKTQIQLGGIEYSGIKDYEKNKEALKGFESKTPASKIKSKNVVAKQQKSQKKSEKKDNLKRKQKLLLKHKAPAPFDDKASSNGAGQFCDGTVAGTSKNVNKQPGLVGGCSDVSGQPPQRKIQKLETVIKRRQRRPPSKNKNADGTGSKKTNHLSIGTTAYVQNNNNWRPPDVFSSSDPGKVVCSAQNTASVVPKESHSGEFVTKEQQKPDDDILPTVRREQVTTLKLLGGKGTLKRHRALKQLVEDNMFCKDRNDFFSSTPFQRTQSSKPLVIPELLDDCDDIFDNIDPNLVNGLKNTDVTPHGLNRVMDYSNSKTPGDTPSLSKTPSGVKPLRKQIDAYVFRLKKKSYFDRRRKILHQNALKSQPINQPSTPRARPTSAMDVLEGVQEIQPRDSDEETDNYFD